MCPCPFVAAKERVEGADAHIAEDRAAARARLQRTLPPRSRRQTASTRAPPAAPLRAPLLLLVPLALFVRANALIVLHLEMEMEMGNLEGLSVLLDSAGCLPLPAGGGSLPSFACSVGQLEEIEIQFQNGHSILSRGSLLLLFVSIKLQIIY